MWKKQGSWNFFHAKLIPNSSITYLFNKNIISVQEEIISYTSLLNEDSLEVIPISKISYFIDYKGHFKGKKRIRYTDIFKSFMETVPLKI